MEQILSIISYVGVALISGLLVWFNSYSKEKGKFYANKEDFVELKKQLSETTELVESVKSSLSEKSWINQQVWLKKQEAYEEIFLHLSHVKKFVHHQISEYESYEYLHHYHPYVQMPSTINESIQNKWDRDVEEYERRKKYNEENKLYEKLEKYSNDAISQVFDLITVKSIYLDPRVGEVIHKLKYSIGAPHEDEDENDYYNRIDNAMKLTMDNIFKISKEELSIEI
ncbi:conserved hypothetical protein [Vibrio chagasii]|uniref:hypothetical protein n=1 Tax=Vibrio TaxID=662 RepID=UPI00187FEF93|nr:MULTISPECIES: hypothetical protein [Vibrio]MBE8607677.1 hypothetical protein [Vibrio sp. OPT10]UPR28351.1 hypothetical protein IS519_08895 [Vibrio crassostreae]CAH6912667.1 conserved hypothetical protein [Vibrio chagasii]CAH6941000.1 conserved hypothetical protein [Vibrio chagasii]